MHHRKTNMYIKFQQNRLCKSVKTVRTNLLAQYRKLQLPIVISKKSIILDILHHKTNTYINFQQNRVKTQVKTVLTRLFAKTRQLHKFVTTNKVLTLKNWDQSYVIFYVFRSNIERHY